MELDVKLDSHERIQAVETYICTSQGFRRVMANNLVVLKRRIGYLANPKPIGGAAGEPQNA